MSRRTYIFSVGSGFWDREISKAVSFLIIGIAAILLMWYTMTTAENIVSNFKESPAVHIELRDLDLKSLPE